MSTPQLEDPENVFDLNEAIPETELLDNSIQKGRAQLSVKTRRHRPSRSHFRDSISSTDGEDTPDRKSLDSPLYPARSPLHSALRGPSPSPDSLLASSPVHRDSLLASPVFRDSLLASPVLRSPAFSFDSTSLVRRSAEDAGGGGSSSPGQHSAPRGSRYRTLTNTTSQEALLLPCSSAPNPICHSTDSSPIYLRRTRRPESEVLVSDDSRDLSPTEPGSPTAVILDKKTRRRFLDLGVTLRRSYVRVRKDKSNRLSMGGRDPSESPSRSSASFVPSFTSWFSDGHRGSSSSSSNTTNHASSSASPRLSSHIHSPRKSNSQESALSDEFCPGSPDASNDTAAETRTHSHSHSNKQSSQPYQTLSQSSDEACDERVCVVSSWSPAQVCEWLKGLNMEQYTQQFTARHIDGQQLLQMDSSKLKGLGVVNSSDRSALKRRIKDIHAAAEKERKALGKLERQRERQRKREQEQRKS
ncbi:sterile alpha motif domain-containing protein 14-like [Engraulis encrasicolus]|uniref:sterile alpha motif domain-containing protein 14-like n=1 Tax=Engraulis encrasicolus TaxID=184585 RepID=UPI002FD56895